MKELKAASGEPAAEPSAGALGDAPQGTTSGADAKGTSPALGTQSDTVTEGVRVKVRSFYVRAQSMPEQGQFFFAYNVQIINEGQSVVHLRSRYWRITDGNSKCVRWPPKLK